MIFFLVRFVAKIFTEEEANTGGDSESKETLIQGVQSLQGGSKTSTSKVNWTKQNPKNITQIG